jgi:hypothetical protein
MTSASEAIVKDGVLISSEIDPEEVESALNGEVGDRLAAFSPQVTRALAAWAEDYQQTYTSDGKVRDRDSYWPRDRYVTPGKVFEQMALAYQALDDDIVGAVADTSEAIAFQKVAFQCDDEDQDTVWSQIGRDLNLDDWLRVAWRELFTCSQFYGVRNWGFKEYKVEGQGDVRAKRKTYGLMVPTDLGFLDPTRVVPVANDIFGNARLAWIANEWEQEQFQNLASDIGLVAKLIVGKYKPTKKEEADLQKENIPIDNLWELNPDMVFRHTLTRSPYERWAKLRMKGIFPLLDLKTHLREMDRAWVRGGINFIVLVTRGTDERPTTKAEVDSTTALMRTHSRSPVIVSDHRIAIEIITPEVEHVLDKDKWTVLDERIMMRLWGTFQLPSETSNRETSITLGRVIARGLASRRHMLKRTIEKELIRAISEHPINERAKFSASTSIEFAPRQMELQLDPALITLIQELRDRGDLSRETVLTEFNFNQEMEAHNREIEAEKYDKIFTPVNVPFDSPDKTTPGGSGRTGGKPPGAGPQPQENGPPRPAGER